MKGAVAFFMVQTCLTDCAGAVVSALANVAGRFCESSWTTGHSSSGRTSRRTRKNRADRPWTYVYALTGTELLEMCQEIAKASESDVEPQSFEEMTSYVGQRVHILLDHESTHPTARLVGTLRALTPDGEALVILDDGTPRYCWPCLRVEATV